MPQKYIQNCGSCHGIKLMSHTVKLWERIIEKHSRHETITSKNQIYVMLERVNWKL